MRVREAINDDHDAVLELLQHLHPQDAAPAKSISKSVFEEIVNSAYLAILVAEDKGRIVGTCYINIIPNLTRAASPYAVIENVVTHPQFRRQGIGSALMAQALTRAQGQGCYKAMLFTGGADGVLDFYRNCGLLCDSKTAFIIRWNTGG